MIKNSLISGKNCTNQLCRGLIDIATCNLSSVPRGFSEQVCFFFVFFFQVFLQSKSVLRHVTPRKGQFQLQGYDFFTTLKERSTWQCGSKGHGDLDHGLCPQGQLLVRRHIPTLFEGPSPKHCRDNLVLNPRSLWPWHLSLWSSAGQDQHPI